MSRLFTVPKPRFVYFIRRADGEGPVKIGCSEYPESRLSGLMAWSPYPLAILATIPGAEDVERRFHARFAHLHSHREWFHWAAEIAETVAAIIASEFDVDTLPKGRRVCHPGNMSISHITRRRIGFQAGLSAVLHRTGYEPTAAVRSIIDGFDKIPENNRAAAEASIRAFFAEPHSHGVPAPYPWCEERRQSYRATLRRAA